MSLLKFFIFLVISRFLRSKASTYKPRSLLIIRLDRIGDYMLFRNFIEMIKKSDKYKDYSLTLCGNIAWKEIAERFDSEYIDNFIWIDSRLFKSFIRGFFYRLRVASELQKINYEVVFSPVYSRSFLLDVLLVLFLKADKIIGVKGDLLNISRLQQQVADCFYDDLINITSELRFEFYTNKLICEKFLGELVSIEKPRVSFDKTAIVSNDLPGKFAGLFLSASKESRKWPMHQFVRLARLIHEKYSINVVALGSSEDSAIFSTMNKDNVTVKNLIGKTTLLELIRIISFCNILVTNDTCSLHFAAALGVPVVVVSNGAHNVRFHPYPTTMGLNMRVVYPRDFSGYQSKSSFCPKKPERIKKVSIENIEFSDVAKAVESILDI